MSKALGLISLMLAGWLGAIGTAPALADGSLSVPLRASDSASAMVVEEVVLYRASHALVIGIDDYMGGWPRLSNAVKDAEIVAEELRLHGFDVTLKTNLTSPQLMQALQEFFVIKGDDPEARLFLWFAGHGHSEAGEGFLVPADAPRADEGPTFKLAALPMRRFGEYVRLARSKHVYAVFDSCFSGTIFDARRALPPRAITRATQLPVRQFLSAGDADQTVFDNGTFRDIFLRALRGEEGADANSDGYVTASEIGMFMADRVTNLTRTRQTPRFGKLLDKDFDRGEFVFQVSAAAGPTVAAAPDPSTATRAGDGPRSGASPAVDELTFWQAVQSSNDPGEYEEFLRQFPDGRFAGLAKRRMETLQQRQLVGTPPAQPAVSAPAAPAPAARPAASPSPQAAAAPQPPPSAARPAVMLSPRSYPVGEAFKDCEVCPEMVAVPAGRFMMGAGQGDRHWSIGERPVHEVTLARPFAVGRFEVTRGEYATFVRETGYRVQGQCSWQKPSFAQTDFDPVVCVSWTDAKKYVDWLKQRTRKPYRLLTESEWEYAARAGTTTERPWGDDANAACEYANVADLTLKDEYDWAVHDCEDRHVHTAPVGSFKPNAFGVYDMMGNVTEWVEDCNVWTYRDTPSDGAAHTQRGCRSHGVRGGSWTYRPDIVRSAERDARDRDFREDNLGFRVARDLE